MNFIVIYFIIFIHDVLYFYFYLSSLISSSEFFRNKLSYDINSYLSHDIQYHIQIVYKK